MTTRRWAFAAATWAFVFAIFHIVWAAGWYPLLDAEEARVAFATRWKWIYDVVVAVVCVIAVPVALATVTSWGRHVPRRFLNALVWTGAGLLLARSIASVVHTIYLVSAGQFQLAEFSIWEPWFYLGAVLFTFTAVTSVRRISSQG